MRSRYLMVLETYVRWAFAWFLPVIALWVYQGVAIVAPHDARSFPLGADWAMFGLFTLGTFAAVLYAHLGEMIGSERGRVTPRLAQVHLIVAGALASLLAVMMPLTLSLATYGLRGPHLAVVALTIAEFSVPFYLARWNRWLVRLLGVPLAIAIVVFVTINLPVLTPASWVTTRAGVSTMLLVSIVCLFSAAHHCLHFDEEMATPREGTGDRWTISERAGRGFGYALWLVTLHKRGRLGHRNHPLCEGLWRRALHWDAAWRNIATAFALGALGGLAGLFYALMSFTTVRSGNFVEFPPLTFIILIPACAIIPPVWVLSPPQRTCWISEFLRPYTRQQLLRAAALALAISTLVGVFGLLGIPLIAIGIANGVFPMTRPTFRALAFAFSGAVSFFALGIGNWRAPRAKLLLILVVIVYTVAVWTPLVEPIRVSNLEVASRVLGLLLLGSGITVAAYRSWLNRDVV